MSVEQGESIKFPNSRESYIIVGGLLVAVGGEVAAVGLGDTPAQQVDNLKQENSSLKAEIVRDIRRIDANKHKITAMKAENPGLKAPGVSLGSEIAMGGGLLCLAVGGFSWGYRALKMARWQRKALKSG